MRDTPTRCSREIDLTVTGVSEHGLHMRIRHSRDDQTIAGEIHQSGALALRIRAKRHGKASSLRAGLSLHGRLAVCRRTGWLQEAHAACKGAGSRNDFTKRATASCAVGGCRCQAVAIICSGATASRHRPWRTWWRAHRSRRRSTTSYPRLGGQERFSCRDVPRTGARRWRRRYCCQCRRWTGWSLWAISHSYWPCAACSLCWTNTGVRGRRRHATCAGADWQG